MVWLEPVRKGALRQTQTIPPIHGKSAAAGV